MKTDDNLKRTDAGLEAKAARSRLLTTVQEVKHRLAPSTLAQDIKTKVRQKANDTAQASIDAAKSNPSAVIGFVAAAVLLVFRKPIFGAVKKLTKEKHHGK